MQEYAGTRQPDFVMPSRPARPGADSQICPPPTAIAGLLYALTRHGHDEIRQANSARNSLAIQHPFDTCVSYGSDTTVRQIRHFSDTNHLAPDTKSVECPYLRVDANPPNNSLIQLRRNPPTTYRPRQSPIVELVGPIRASYDSGTNGTPRRYKSLVYSYKPSSTPYLALAPSPAQISAPSAPTNATKHERIPTVLVIRPLAAKHCRTEPQSTIESPCDGDISPFPVNPLVATIPFGQRLPHPCTGERRES